MIFEKLKNLKMSEEVANQVLKLIRNGKLKPGDKLPVESELSSSLGVSRTAVREGLQRLLALNIIEVMPGRGTFIKNLPLNELLRIRELNEEKITKDVLLEIIEFRKIIETGMIDIVIDKIRDNEVNELKKCILKHEEGITNGAFPAEGDIFFHKVLAEATHNKVIVSFFNDVYKLILESTVGFRDYKKEYKKSLEFHKEIYDNIVKKDKVAAQQAMKNHLEWHKNIVSGLDRF